MRKASRNDLSHFDSVCDRSHSRRSRRARQRLRAEARPRPPHHRAHRTFRCGAGGRLRRAEAARLRCRKRCCPRSMARLARSGDHPAGAGRLRQRRLPARPRPARHEGGPRRGIWPRWKPGRARAICSSLPLPTRKTARPARAPPSPQLADFAKSTGPRHRAGHQSRCDLRPGRWQRRPGRGAGLHRQAAAHRLRDRARGPCLLPAGRRQCGLSRGRAADGIRARPRTGRDQRQ